MSNCPSTSKLHIIEHFWCTYQGPAFFALIHIAVNDSFRKFVSLRPPKNIIIDGVPSTKLIRYKYSDIYNMAEDTLEFAKLNLVAMLLAEKWQLACQCFSYLGNVCVCLFPMIDDIMRAGRWAGILIFLAKQINQNSALLALDSPLYFLVFVCAFGAQMKLE